MTDPRDFQQIRAAHPVPWTARVKPGPSQPGQIIVLDAKGIEVPLFTMLKVVEILTAMINNPAPAPSAQEKA